MAELNQRNFQGGGTTNPPMEQLPGYAGSWQQTLANNVGEYCIIDFFHV